MVSFAGVVAFQSLPIDAYPDVTNIQVQVLTEAPGLSPVEVERFITYPLELQMTGLPGLAEIRSLSKFALSQVTVVFQDDVDIYFARQLVLERMVAAKERLPEGVEPVMAPVSTGLGEVYQYYLVGPHAKDSDEAAVQGELTEQRTLQDWVLRPLFKGIPGVIDVNVLGGFVKQYQVLVDPSKLRKYDLTLHEIYDAVAKNNANAGGNVLERHAERVGVDLNLLVSQPGGDRSPVGIPDRRVPPADHLPAAEPDVAQFAALVVRDQRPGPKASAGRRRFGRAVVTQGHGGHRGPSAGFVSASRTCRKQRRRACW